MRQVEDHFLELLHDLKDMIIGYERSLKITTDGYDVGRLLCGVDSKHLSCDVFLQKLECFHPSAECREWIINQWDKSNFLYLAIEGADPSKLFNNVVEITPYQHVETVIKVYLEFPVLVSTLRNGVEEKGKKSLWCTGYKWSPKYQHERITHYYLRPDLTISELSNLRFYHEIALQEQQDLQLFKQALVDRYPQRYETIDILEVENIQGSNGFDIRLYPLNEAVNKHYFRLDHHFSMMRNNPFYSEINQLISKDDAVIGHLSIGYNSNMRHLTLYWELNNDAI